MQKKALLIYKYPHGAFNFTIIKRFSNYYDTKHLYISDFSDKNFTEIITEINNFIKKNNIDIVVFDVDYFKFINAFFIDRINVKKKAILSGDDFENHQMNSITASYCDMVLSTCPLSVLKYKEKGFDAHYIPYEAGEFKDHENEKRDIDVLFFGELTNDRNNFLNFIDKEGIKLKNVGFEKNSKSLSDAELNKLISRSKIVLNLSKTKTDSVKSHNSSNVFKSYYQLKGRIFDSAMKGALCVSEYSPGQELLFSKDEIPTFYTPEECAKILKELLNNTELLLKFKNNFIQKAKNIFDEKKNFKPIYESFEKQNARKVKIFSFPYWYLRTASKQILLRNIKIKNLIKTFFQFKIIFKVIKYTNAIGKILIVLESILNIIWYSLISIFKSNK